MSLINEALKKVQSKGESRSGMDPVYSYPEPQHPYNVKRRGLMMNLKIIGSLVGVIAVLSLGLLGVVFYLLSKDSESGELARAATNAAQVPADPGQATSAAAMPPPAQPTPHPPATNSAPTEAQLKSPAAALYPTSIPQTAATQPPPTTASPWSAPVTPPANSASSPPPNQATPGTNPQAAPAAANPYAAVASTGRPGDNASSPATDPQWPAGTHQAAGPNYAVPASPVPNGPPASASAYPNPSPTIDPVEINAPPPPAPRRPNQEVVDYINKIEVRGIRPGGRRVLVYDGNIGSSQAYNVGSIVNLPLQITIVEIKDDQILFQDHAGVPYIKYF